VCHHEGGLALDVALGQAARTWLRPHTSATAWSWLTGMARAFSFPGLCSQLGAHGGGPEAGARSAMPPPMANLFVTNIFVTMTACRSSPLAVAANVLEAVTEPGRDHRDPVALMREEGLERVTMRRLAAALDTGPSSLYVYVRNLPSSTPPCSTSYSGLSG